MNAKVICLENKGLFFALSVPVKKLNAGLILLRAAGRGANPRVAMAPCPAETVSTGAKSLDSGSETQVQGPAPALVAVPPWANHVVSFLSLAEN